MRTTRRWSSFVALVALATVATSCSDTSTTSLSQSAATDAQSPDTGTTPRRIPASANPDALHSSASADADAGTANIADAARPRPDAGSAGPLDAGAPDVFDAGAVNPGDATGADAGAEDTAPPDSATNPPDAGEAPPSQPVYDPATTVTIHLHGWNLKGPAETGVFAQDEGGGPIVDDLQTFAELPHGKQNPDAPNQIVGTSYYGTEPPDWWTPEQQAELDAITSQWGGGVPRYAYIASQYIAHVLERTGATGFNLTCHSMGCEVSRYLIEHDVGGLASSHKLVRWVTFAGVVGGADLAKIYTNNDFLKQLASNVSLDEMLIDVEHMKPEWYAEHVVVDHMPHQGNNPLFAGFLVHHAVATRPGFPQALGLPILDLDNPQALPNDGIVFCKDEYLHSMAPEAQFVTPDGAALEASRAYTHVDHFAMRDDTAAHVLGAAALVGRRRVTVRLTSLTVLDDNEKDGLFRGGGEGFEPAEVFVESAAWFEPWLPEHFGGVDPALDHRTMAGRVVPIWTMHDGETVEPDYVLFDGFVFDEMDSLTLLLDVKEADWYPTFDVYEDPLDPEDRIAKVKVPVSLTDSTLEVDLGNATATLEVTVHAMW